MLFNIICGIIAGLVLISACLTITTIVKAAIKEMSRKPQIRKEADEYLRILGGN